MFKLTIFALVLLSLFPVCGLAQSPPPSPEAIVERSIVAMGGRNALHSIRTITAIADCVSPQGPYTTEIHSARGDRLKFKQVRSQGKPFLAFANGHHFWTQDEATGQVSLADNKLAAMIRSHEFQLIALSPLERYNSPAFEGYEDFGGARCLKVRATDELGKMAHLYFREDQKLMAGLVVTDPRFETPRSVRIVFKEWRRVGKAKLPSKVIATDDTGDFTLHFNKISLNQADERIFEIPKKIAAMNELLQLHEQQRVAHLSKNAELLVSLLAENFINVADGKITKPSREESLRRFRPYLERSTFLEWDDVSPPVIRVSDDASMASVIVHKRVRITAPDEKGDSRQDAAVFAWLETYEKRNGKWAITAIASTKTTP